MRVPVRWLKSYCDPGLGAEEIAERLTAAGLELDTLHRVGVGELDEFVVGRVLKAEQHPDADRLSVCVVDDGSGQPRTIVCGAPNVAAGQTVAVARPGAVMPDGTVLGEAKLRGVKSSGMILAEDELGIGEDHAGIIVLNGEGEPGQALADVLPIADEVLEIEVNPNRPDALAVYGVARDLHALTGAELAPDPTDEDAQPSGDDVAEDHATVTIEDPEICLRFTGRVFEDVKIGPSPPWLKQRLMAAGQRPISNVVDITNYVMLCCGQPLHAFDLDKVRGGKIVVRRAREGETMTTLDGVERRFDPDVALVCDAEGPSGIAGVMGGQISEVSEDTTRVLMEAATWVGPNILRTSKKLALRTEASARFEKQLHPELAIKAQRLAARLMVELAGARLVPGTLDDYPSPAEERVVGLRYPRIGKLLGKEIERDEVEQTLTRLGFGLEPDGDDAWRVTVPVWRDSDVQREADLIEEVARVHGLDSLPATLPARRKATGGLTDHQKLRRRLEDSLRDRGLTEIIAWSFTAPEKIERARLDRSEALPIANPLSEDQSVMRPLLLPGLLDAAALNAAHGRPAVALYESAHVFHGPLPDQSPEGSPGGTTPADEHHHLAALLTEARPAGWRSQRVPGDFHATRALVDALLAAAGLEWRAEPEAKPWLHPGRAAKVIARAAGGAPGGGPAGGDASLPGPGELELGWIGELHPLVTRAWELTDPVGAFELDVDAIAELAAGHVDAYRPVPSFPAVLQDIAVVVPDDVPAAQVERAARAGGGELLERIQLFDLYRGEQVGEGNKSLALRLEFRAPDRTLTDEEVAGLRGSIEAELEKLGGRLRG
jgi:phenylalanyl-tRNA synthetase beta chain